MPVAVSPASHLARPAPAEIGPGPLSPEAVLDIIAATAPSDAIYVNESTSTVEFPWRRLPMQDPGSYYEYNDVRINLAELLGVCALAAGVTVKSSTLSLTTMGVSVSGPLPEPWA